MASDSKSSRRTLLESISTLGTLTLKLRILRLKLEPLIELGVSRDEIIRGYDAF